MAPPIHPVGPGASRFIGRDEELERLDALFAGGARVVTVLGPGGIGKTRLAARFASERADRWSGHAFATDLTDAHGVLDVCAAVARAMSASLGRSPTEADAVEAVAAALRRTGPVLLLLDDFEQVVDDGARTVAGWLASAPDLSVLVTSRERLRVAGEATLDLAPLPHEHAVRLFLDRASAVRDGYAPEGAELEAVEAMCRELDGLPLAIELAAARVRVLSAEKLHARIRGRLHELGGGTRDGPARHATLRAAIDGSWEQLEPHESRALAQCSVFEGGFTLESAEVVLRLQDAPPVIDVLAALRDKSLLWTEVAAPNDELRFGLYVPIRQYARDELRSMGEWDDTVRRHAEHYLLAALIWTERVERREALEERARLELEQANLLAIHRRALEADRPDWALQAAIGLQQPLIFRGPGALRLEVLDAALRGAPEKHGLVGPVAVGWTLLARGEARHRYGRLEEARRDLERALSIAHHERDARMDGRTRWRIGALEHTLGRWDRAREQLTRALEVHREIRDRLHEGRMRALLGAVERDAGDLDAAREHLEAALAIHDETGDRRWSANSLGAMGILLHVEGRLDDAERFLERALEQHRACGHRGYEGWDLGHLATVAHARRDLDEARSRYERALSLGEEIPDRHVEGWFHARLGSGLDDAGDAERAREALDAALEIGRRLSDPRLGALAFALLGRLEVRRHDLPAADRLYAAADREAAEAAQPRVAAVVNVLRGHLDLARGDRAAAEARLAADAPPSVDLRYARDGLARELTEDGDDTFVIAADGGWFEAAGQRVSLQTRKAPRLVLARLLAERREHPGRTLSVEDLFEAGWPGEQALPDAAASRVYVAVSTLRKLGLRDVLTREEEGYRLDPKRPVRTAD